MIAVGSGDDQRRTGWASRPPSPVDGAGLTTPVSRPAAVPTVCPHCFEELYASGNLGMHVRYYCRDLYGRSPLSPGNPLLRIELARLEGPTS
jgi:hypothetical protein